MRAFSVRHFFLFSILSWHIESAIDMNRKTEIITWKENKMAYRESNTRRRANDVRYEMVEHIGVLNHKDSGWTREVNIVAWNDGKAKVDIREWDPEHTRMSRGLTLLEEEAETLARLLAKRYRLDSPDGWKQDRPFGDPDGAAPEASAVAESTESADTLLS